MRKSFYSRFMATFVLVAHSLSASGYEMSARHRGEPQGRMLASIVMTRNSLDDFEKVYSEAADKYRLSGPRAFVDALPFIKTKEDRQHVLNSLSKLPDLAKLERCAEDCLRITVEDQSVELHMGDLMAGRFRVGSQEHSVDWRRDNFESIANRIEAGLGRELAATPKSSSIWTDFGNRVCKVVFPEAHAGIGKTIVIALIVIAAAAAVWYFGSKLVDHASKKASSVIKEGDALLTKANKDAKDRINQVSDEANAVIDRANDKADAIIDKANTQGQAIVDSAAKVVDSANTVVDSANSAIGTLNEAAGTLNEATRALKH